MVAEAGLFDGKRMTTHWYYRPALERRHPDARYVPDRRFVVDADVASTTGITASMPMMLTLVEAIAGRDKAAAVARDLGVDHWDARHDSDAFRFDQPFALTVLRNRLAFWRRETFAIALEPGVDEVTLGLAADAWSRTYRSRAVTYATRPEVVTRGGLRIVPDRVGTPPADLPTVQVGGEAPMRVLDRTLVAIARRHGSDTAGVVAMQLEYADWPGAATD